MEDVNQLLTKLEEDGIVMLPQLMSDEELSSMQKAFDTALSYPRWNTNAGYQQNEKWRLLVEDVLVLDPGFLALAIHPIPQQIFRAYIGSQYILSEARGWETIATKRKFHGWHNDAWYDLEAVKEKPRELKLGFYLTDVETGYFEYVRGSHRYEGEPKHWSDRQIAAMSPQVIRAKGKAGQAFVFDTAGIHRQSSPVLTPRRALLYTYHDPSIPIQALDKKFGRYHPLLLNAAFIGGLTAEQSRILGVGNFEYHKPNFQSQRRYRYLHQLSTGLLKARLELQDLQKIARDVKSGIVRRLKTN